MTTHQQIISELESELAKTKEVSEKLSEQMEFAIGHYKIAWAGMCELVGQLGQAGTSKTGVELVADGTINVEIDNNGYHTIRSAIY
jgi:hypothetical protein